MPHWILQKLSPVLLKPEFIDNPEKPCRLIVEMASPYTDRVATYIEANEGKVHCEMRLMPLVVVEVPYSAIEYMLFSPHVRKIWHDTRVKALLDTAVPTVGAGKTQSMGFTGKDVTVAVIDTGLFPHPDLVYPENRIVAWHDLVNERNIPYDDNGHGTHVTGIIAGNGTASRGKYTGIAPEAKVVAIKALDKEGAGNTSDVISAFEWCIENQKNYNIKAINLSVGSTAEDSAREDPLCRAVTAAWSRGMVVCIAAGNDGPDMGSINTPGINPNAITVGNLDDKGTVETDDDNINDSSSRGPTVDNIMKPDILAPGTEITSLRVGGGYRSLTGTSMAAPMATGAVAQIFQKYPEFKPDQVKSELMKNARKMGMQANYEGSGALNIETIFEEKKKENTNQNPIFKIFFGKDSIIAKLFNWKPAIKNNKKDKKDVKDLDMNEEIEEKPKANIGNMLQMAMLALLPLVLI